jgi:hypothetical protein
MKPKLYSFNFILALLLFIMCSGCGTLQRVAVKQVGNALSSKATMDVITSDNDPELIWDAMPFALKSMEVMLVQDPSNTELQLALASGYIQYAQGHLAQEAQILEDTDYHKSQHLWYRTYNLSLRGKNYALAALDLRHSGFSKKIISDTKSALSQTTLEDVPSLYWAGAGWAGAISANKTDMENMAELPVAVAMMRRVLELDDAYREGAAHEFFIAYEAGQPNSSSKTIKKAEMHFNKAIEYSGGKKAYPYVLFAECVAVPKQNLPLFKKLLNQALAVDVNDVMEWRLINTIAHERALWLKKQIPILFLDYEENE